jgi:hypothetical protein
MTRKLFVLPIVCLPVFSCGGGQEESVEAPSPTEAPPTAVVVPTPRPSGARIAFASDTINFGEVWDLDELSCSFEFTNEGDSPLLVTEVKPSCGCTPTELQRTRFEPGEGDAIEVKWKVKGFGSQAKTIAVSTNSEGMGMTMLTVRAKIRPFARFEPVALRLGDLDLGETHTATVRLTCVDPEFVLVSVAPGNKQIAARDLGAASEGGRRIEVTLSDTLPWGPFISSISARVRGRLEGREEPVDHLVRMSLSASMLGDLRIEPDFFTVGRVPPGGVIRYEALLSSASGSPFEVTELHIEGSQPPGMEVRIEATPEGGKRLLLEGETGDYLGLIRGWVVFSTDLPGEGPRRLSVMGIVRK